MLDFDGNECGAGFDTEGQLKSHAGRVHERNTFLCTICPPEDGSNIANPTLENRQASFSTYAALRDHIGNEHPPACTECGQECKSLRDLKSHLEVIHGSFDVNDSKTHFCHERGCGRGFTKKGNLSIHVQISHNPNRFICGGIDPLTLSQVVDWDGTNSCGKALTTKAGLEEHIRTVHQDLAPSHKNKRQTKHGDSDEQARKHQVSVLTRLTGAGYEESGRSIPCLVIGCNHCFLREYDLEIHLRSRHGSTGLGPQEILMNQERLYSRQTLQGIPTVATKQDADAEKALDMQFDEDVGAIGQEETLGAGALRGGDSWLEGQSYHDRGDSGVWLHDELEMQCLYDEGLVIERHEMVDDQKVDVIDPVLG